MSAPVQTHEQSPAVMAALAVIGEAWLATLADVGEGMSKVDRSLALDGAVWRPVDVAGRAAFPRGLNLAEALGATYVMRWAMNGHRTQLDALTLPVARALLVVRRAAFPSIPWRPRDPVAEELQRIIRAMEVKASPVKREVLVPYTAPSDLGRAWR